MRPPPVQSTALQQHEGGKQQQQQQQIQQIHLQQSHQVQPQSFYSPATVTDLSLQHARHKSGQKLQQQREFFIVENHLSFACSAAATTTTATSTVTTTATNAAARLPPPQHSATYQPHFAARARHSHSAFSRSAYIANDAGDDDADNVYRHDDGAECNADDSIQLVDLSTSPPTPDVPVPFGSAAPRPDLLTGSRLPATKRASSLISDCAYSRSSSNEDCSYSGGERLHAATYASVNSFDDAAEHFIINFPADSPAHNPHDCIINLPLSETEPLLTNIETAAPADTRHKRALCLSKNSASLIFTKKELPHSGSAAPANGRYYTPATKASNNNCSGGTAHNTAQRRHHSERNRQQSKHLPATYHQQQRRSLQLNYNNNLVTTSTCGANNNVCCAAPASSLTGSDKSLTPSSGNGSGGVVLHKHHSALSTSPGVANTTAAATRKQHAYSWYAPVYSALEEELEQDSRDSSPIHNLANTKKHHSSNHYQHHSSHNSTATAADNETVALLETRNQINIQAQLHPPQTQRDPHGGSAGSQAKRGQGTKAAAAPPTSLALPHVPQINSAGGVGGSKRSIGSLGGGSARSSGDFSSVGALGSHDGEGPHAGSLGLAGGPLPRRRRFENFLKSLVGLKPSSGRNGSAGAPPVTPPTHQQQLQLPASPEITITRTPSEQNVVVLRDPAGHHQLQHPHVRHGLDKLANGAAMQGSTSSLNVVQQKLWNMMRREGSAASLNHEKSHSIVQYNGMRKCETVLALTRQQSHSLCSPVYADPSDGLGEPHCGAGMPHSGSGIFSASGVEQIRPLNRLRNSVSSINGAGATCSRCSSLLSLAASGSRYSLNVATNGSVGGFVHSSASQQQLSTAPCQQQQRNSSNVSSSNVSSSNNRSLDTNQQQQREREQVSVSAATATAAVASNSSGYCSRKSSAGVNSSHSTSSISPPSNKTTATLNSSLTPSTSTPATPTRSTSPTVTRSNNTNSGNAVARLHATADSHAGIFISFPASGTGAVSCATSHPLTVSSLFSKSFEDKEHDVVDGGAPASATSGDEGNAVTLQPAERQQQAQVFATPTVTRPFQVFTCKLCLIDVESAAEATTLQLCGCQFCTECMRAYVEFEISEAAYEISCPDAQCPAQGIMTLPEIASLTTANLIKKHHRYRLNREIELDKSRTWCPRAGCETVCRVGTGPHSDVAPSTSTSSTQMNAALSPGGAASFAAAAGSDGISPFLCAVKCPSCKDEFCSACKKTWHPNTTCEENSRRLVADGQDDIGIPFDNDLIKCCPMCAVPIEKDEGCAQMMCKRCKHVFCWYCLASLDDDFLLRHYDKGPCKNKLGHSRASVVWHRAQVIGIFAGFGILLLVASPLLLLAAPCIICCKCRICSGSKIDEGDGDLDEATALQS